MAWTQTPAFWNGTVAEQDSELMDAIKGELDRQQNQIELIASENIVSRAVMEAQGSVMTNKYAEGYAGRRYYGGCEHVDVAEELAIDRGGEIMQLELLVPTEFIHEDKVVLTKWYTKIGYQKVGTHDVDYVHQGISQFLIADCRAEVYEKPLI